ncbi:MAG: hypothetical protein AUJ07_05555 [Crenarchaeota archaeon 13_1_40CM_3_53_5]|nr:MAG: hypothetical protein AUJ07_05555 [Crenarchaeota archaeon 13_1_40CM_3_53_5]
MQNMSESIGSTNRPKAQVSEEPRKLRFLVAIEFSGKEAAIDHFVDLTNTGWPKGPRQKDLKLIVISRQWDEGRVEGLEDGTGELNRLNTMLDGLA